jgi:hypothetical protein
VLNLLPGQGLGTEASELLAFGLGSYAPIAVEPEIQVIIEDEQGVGGYYWDLRREPVVYTYLADGLEFVFSLWSEVEFTPAVAKYSVETVIQHTYSVELDYNMARTTEVDSQFALGFDHDVEFDPFVNTIRKQDEDLIMAFIASRCINE